MCTSMRSKLTRLVIGLKLDLIELSSLKADKALLANQKMKKI